VAGDDVLQGAAPVHEWPWPEILTADVASNATNTGGVATACSSGSESKWNRETKLLVEAAHLTVQVDGRSRQRGESPVV
jgi:hypothetical protein